MVNDQKPRARKIFKKIYYLLLAPVVAVGFMISTWAISASQTALAIESFPEFLPDEQSASQEGEKLTAENYLPLATTEIECGQALDPSVLPQTVKVVISPDVGDEEAGDTPAAEIADITAEWDTGSLDINTPGSYQLNIKLPGDYTYDGVLPYVIVQVKQLELQPEESTAAVETKGAETQSAATQPPQEDAGSSPVSAGTDDKPADPAKPCQHEEGCSVVCEDKNDCQHICDENCIAPSKEIEQFCGLYPSGSVSARFDVEKGSKQAFTAERNVTAYMTDGKLMDIPIKWVGSYSLDTPGVYRISMQVMGGYIWNGPDMIAEIIVYDSESGR